MAVKLLVFGPTKESFFQKSEEEYLKRLKRFCKLQYEVLPAARNTEQREQSLKMEEDVLFRHLNDQSYLVLLDEKGEHWSSRKFAQKLNESLIQHPNIVFVIGGAFGFSEKVRERANVTWSLSKLTFPHHLVRTIFLEQLYRAFTILNGGKYHND